MGDKRAEVIRLLNVLRGYYSLRDLQGLLGVPYQTLWKYVNLLSVPEERTCERILSRISELNLVERVVKEEISRNEGSVWSLTRKSGFLLLFALAARSFLKGARVSTVVPMSELGIALGAAVAVELHIDICPALSNPPVEKRGHLIITYESHGKVVALALPRACLKEKGRVLLVDPLIEDFERVKAFTYALRHARTSLHGIMAIKIGGAVKERLQEEGIRYYSLA